MKKVISLTLILVICLSLCACGESQSEITVPESTIFEMPQKDEKHSLAEDAYREIENAYDIVHQFGANIYDAWYIGAIEPAMIQKNGVSFFAANVALSEEEIKGGLGYFQAYIEDKNWDELTDLERKNYVDNGDTFLKGVSNSNVLQTSIYTVPFAYIVSGKTEEVQNSLNRARQILRELNERYPDYEHYQILKEYYTTTNAYFEFCQKPKGTFEMLESTINDYMNAIRDCQSELDFVYGE